MIAGSRWSNTQQQFIVLFRLPSPSLMWENKLAKSDILTSLWRMHTHNRLRHKQDDDTVAAEPGKTQQLLSQVHAHRCLGFDDDVVVIVVA